VPELGFRSLYPNPLLYRVSYRFPKEDIDRVGELACMANCTYTSVVQYAIKNIDAEKFMEFAQRGTADD